MSYELLSMVVGVSVGITLGIIVAFVSYTFRR